MQDARSYVLQCSGVSWPVTSGGTLQLPVRHEAVHASSGPKVMCYYTGNHEKQIEYCGEVPGRDAANELREHKFIQLVPTEAEALTKKHEETNAHARVELDPNYICSAISKTLLVEFKCQRAECL